MIFFTYIFATCISSLANLLALLLRFLYRFYLFIFRERGKEGEREGEKHQCVVASWAPPTGDLACNPGMCPDWESNRWPFGLQAALNPLSYASQGSYWVLSVIYILCIESSWSDMFYKIFPLVEFCLFIFFTISF